MKRFKLKTTNKKARLENGKIVDYVICQPISQRMMELNRIYLGRGTIHSIDGKLQEGETELRNFWGDLYGRRPRVVFDFSELNREVYANDPKSLVRIEYLTREARDSDPGLANYAYYVIADESYKAITMLKLPHHIPYPDETPLEIIRAYAKDKLGVSIVYQWDNCSEWSLKS